MLLSVRRKLGKIKFHLQMFDWYRKNEISATPTYLQIEPTVRCNLSCLTCTRSRVIKDYRKMDMDVEEVSRLLSHFPKLKYVKLQGLGEPLFHPQIKEMLQLFRDRKVKVWMITNGTLFLQEKYRNLVLDYVPDIVVSMDSVSRETFNRLRRGADFERVVEGLKLLVSERNQKRAGTIIGVNFVVSHENYQELDALGKLAAALKIDYVTVADVENWMIPGEEGYEEAKAYVAESRKCAKEIDKGVKKLRTKLLRHGILLGYKNRARRLGRCHWPFNSMFITVEGFANPCCLRMHKRHSFDNILEKPFEEVWNGQQYRDFRRSHIDKDASNAMCANCPD